MVQNPAGPPPPLDWKFSQVFGERTAGEEVQEGKRLVTGHRLYLKSKRRNLLAIQLQHLSSLPKIFQLEDLASEVATSNSDNRHNYEKITHQSRSSINNYRDSRPQCSVTSPWAHNVTYKVKRLYNSGFFGPEVYVNTNPVDVGKKPVTHLCLYLKGKRKNRLAIHLQHLSSLPKNFRLQDFLTIIVTSDSDECRHYYETVPWKTIVPHLHCPGQPR
ncbi:hypothetical protein L1887_27341 [Cichorium endivia]|nr:hypothetical protein L1887_27341 [Cichorium endivia]